MRHVRLGRRLFLLSLGGAFPVVVVACLAGPKNTVEDPWIWPALLVAVTWLVGCATLQRNMVAYHIRTITNLLSALREGDYSFRLGGGHRGGALGEAILEVNALASELFEQRVGDLEATALLRKVMAEIDVAVFAFDPDQLLRLANPSGEKLLGEPAVSLEGLPASSLGLSSCLEGPPARTIDLRLPGGVGRWELRRGGFRQQGRPHTLIVLSDVSRALRSEELIAWRRLIRVISHELNNSLAPIKSIASSLERMLDRSDGNREWQDDARRGLAVISSRADALNRFMAAYTALAKLPSPTMGPVHVRTWIRRITGLEKRVPVDVFDGPDIVIHADADQLDQLLINIIQNAAEAALDTGGGVVVCWDVCESWLVVDVLDDGDGLPDSANVFVPFFTTKADGSGIGLVLCRQIAESHGGTLQLEARQDGPGCRASLRLPLRTEASYHADVIG